MIKDIAHIAMNPLDMDKTVEFFDKVFGWKKVFELHKENGDPWIIYLKICKGHFLELFYGGQNEYAADRKLHSCEGWHCSQPVVSAILWTLPTWRCSYVPTKPDSSQARISALMAA